VYASIDLQHNLLVVSISNWTLQKPHNQSSTTAVTVKMTPEIDSFDLIDPGTTLPGTQDYRKQLATLPWQ
jgi:hypothetical protein